MSLKFNPFTGTFDFVGGGTNTTTTDSSVIEDFPCDLSVAVGDAVYIDTNIAYQGKADDAATTNIIGIVESKSSSILCNIRTSGKTLGVFTLLDETKEYFLSATIAGGIVDYVPTLPGHVILRIGKPVSATELSVIIGERILRS